MIVNLGTEHYQTSGLVIMFSLLHQTIGLPINLILFVMYRIVDLHRSYVFTVENLLTGETQEVHGDRIQFYCDKFLNVTDELLKQFQHDTGNRQVEKICDARLDSTSTNVEYLVKWKGFSDQENSWCSRDKIRKNYPGAIQEFLSHFPYHPFPSIISASLPKVRALVSK